MITMMITMMITTLSRARPPPRRAAMEELVLVDDVSAPGAPPRFVPDDYICVYEKMIIRMLMVVLMVLVEDV